MSGSRAPGLPAQLTGTVTSLLCPPTPKAAKEPLAGLGCQWWLARTYPGTVKAAPTGGPNGPALTAPPSGPVSG